MGTQTGDLHWEMVRAGEYETDYFVNGYKYRVIKDSRQINVWYAYYMWHKTPIKKRAWKRLRRGYLSSHDTKKGAQSACWSHNQRPRTKYKYVGAVPRGESNYRSRSAGGMLAYRECDKDGVPFKSGSEYYLDPTTFYSLVSYIGDREGFEEAIAGRPLNART